MFEILAVALVVIFLVFLILMVGNLIARALMAIDEWLDK